MHKVVIEEDRCKGCRICVEFCPMKCLEMGGHLNKKGHHPAEWKHPEKCTACGICALMCPDSCISVYREEK